MLHLSCLKLYSKYLLQEGTCIHTSFCPAHDVEGLIFVTSGFINCNCCIDGFPNHTKQASLSLVQWLCGLAQERARALSELRRLEADIGEANRSLKGAQGDEEALRNKAMHLRDDIDRAELARDKALAAHDRATAVSCSHHLSKHSMLY